MKQRFLVLALVGGVLAGCLAPSEEAVQEEFEAFVAERNHCQADSECTMVAPGCPLGCGTFVNVEHRAAVQAKARELVDDYESGGRRCDYGCGEAGMPVCRDARCEGEVP
jgi:hypothetical protein